MSEGVPPRQTVPDTVGLQVEAPGEGWGPASSSLATALVSWGCCNEVPRAGGLKTTDMYALTVWRPGSEIKVSGSS